MNKTTARALRQRVNAVRRKALPKVKVLQARANALLARIEKHWLQFQPGRHYRGVPVLHRPLTEADVRKNIMLRKEYAALRRELNQWDSFVLNPNWGIPYRLAVFIKSKKTHDHTKLEQSVRKFLKRFDKFLEGKN